MNTPVTQRGTARERILDVASGLFYREGIHAVGIDTIIARSGVAKMTLYHHFASKDALVVAFLQRRDELWRRWLAEAVDRLATTPRQRPLAIFDALAERFASSDYRGCAFINAAAETIDRDSAAYTAVLEHKARVRDYVRTLLEDAGTPDPAGVAAELMILIDGALVTAARERTPAAARTARRIAAQILERDVRRA